jgi:hypothetical protein
MNYEEQIKRLMLKYGLIDDNTLYDYSQEVFQLGKSVQTIIAEWGLEICTEHQPNDRGLMSGVITRRECPICWKERFNME